jgi:prophage regulatory protein
MPATETHQTHASSKPLRILRLPEVTLRTGLPRGSVYEQMALGQFPQPISLTFRTVGWLETEIEAWIQTRVLARRV